MLIIVELYAREGPCGKFQAAFSYTLAVPAARDGYLVQRIHVAVKTAAAPGCVKGEDEEFEYYEAWPVTAGANTSDVEARARDPKNQAYWPEALARALGAPAGTPTEVLQATDTSTLPGLPGSRGTAKITRELRFYATGPIGPRAVDSRSGRPRVPTPNVPPSAGTGFLGYPIQFGAGHLELVESDLADGIQIIPTALYGAYEPGELADGWKIHEGLRLPVWDMKEHNAPPGFWTADPVGAGGGSASWSKELEWDCCRSTTSALPQSPPGPFTVVGWLEGRVKIEDLLPMPPPEPRTPGIRIADIAW